jgi:hypothetical protein
MNNRHIVFGDSLLLDTFEAVGLLEDKTYLVYKNNLANLLNSNLEPLLERRSYCGAERSTDAHKPGCAAPYTKKHRRFPIGKQSAYCSTAG